MNNNLVYINDKIKDALIKINNNGIGTVFVVDDKNKLKGILTDGDLRREIIMGSKLEDSVKKIMNINVKSLNYKCSNLEILKNIDDKIKIIPLINKKGEYVDYVSKNKLKRIPIASPNLKGNELRNVVDCIESNWISSNGKYVTEFEDVFSRYHNDMFALSVSNGTVALHLALVSLGIGKGDEVILPNLTFSATINAVLYTGAKPVLIDIDKESWNLDISLLKKNICSKTKAIIPVDLYGFPTYTDKILELIKDYDIFLVQDCAESLGSKYLNNPAGVLSDAATFSFFGNKTITTGEGGMVIFKNKKVYEKAKVLRDHGMNKNKRYWNDYVGYNYRFTNLQAAVGLAQFERLDTFVKRKISIAKRYIDFFNKYNFIQTPKIDSNVLNSYWLFTFLVLDNAPFSKVDLIDFLDKNSIDARPVFFPLGDMPPYKSYKTKSFENSAFVSERGLSLSTSPALLDKEVSYICNTLETFFKLKIK